MRSLFAVLGGVAGVHAATYNGFPNALTCSLDDTTTATRTAAEVQRMVTGPAGTLIDPSASNVASGKCTSLRIPYYNVSDGAFGLVAFAYDEASDTYYYCLGQGAITSDSGGYPSLCTES
ncbi:hypothetical protein DL764_002423 [Monosporascus ibericus]|uniref:Uncharacterized protein n=1 Tax=Monosporascus ibericus TaxID=155417 RepID=A0A4Q4TKE8_9PEZI|nr:hypothetical protein DL764_002423 [Monosporascus ibericus]